MFSSPFCLWLNNAILYVYITVYLIDWHLDFFQFLVVFNNAAVRSEPSWSSHFSKSPVFVIAALRTNPT
jgi:hypothetical protein